MGRIRDVVEIPQSRIATAMSRPPVWDIRDTVNPPRGFDQSAMLTSYRVWDYLFNPTPVTLRLPCAIVESPRRHKRVPFVNIAFLRSRSIKRRQWKHKLDYYGVVFAHLATGCGIKAKDLSGLDSDRWIPHSRCCENPARAKALAGFSRHLSAGFTDLNPAPRGLSLYNSFADICSTINTNLFFTREVHVTAGAV